MERIDRNESKCDPEYVQKSRLTEFLYEVNCLPFSLVHVSICFPKPLLKEKVVEQREWTGMKQQ